MDATQHLRPKLALRQDLRLYEGPKVAHAPSWMLYDPVRHRYFQIDRVAFVVLGAWSGPLTSTALLARANASGHECLSLEDVDRVTAFAERNELVEEPIGGYAMHIRRTAAARSSLVMWLVHNYLFIKIPIVRPRAIFERLGFLVAPLYTRGFLMLTIGSALAGAYLVSREWSAFVSTFPSFLSLDGALIYGLTLFGVKLIHELAHAFTAARYRCRVSSIGLAFMVMMPMLYCDVTDSWRLPDRRKRMAIDSAGIAAELVLAVYASLLWVLVPDGPGRTAAFLVATTSIVSSLAINLNPFMRFDGYLMLADALNVPNLQTRAFALLRWKLREVLFALGAAKPEAFGPGKTQLVLVYAAAIIVYRAIIYTGIAFLVYHAFFKLLGIILFGVEIGWFIIGPVTKEMTMWWTLRHDIAVSRRSLMTATIAVLLIIGLFFPFRSTVEIPAVLEPAAFAHVYPATAGQVASVAVRSGDRVTAGAPLAVLVSPKLDQDTRLASIRLSLVNARLQRRSSVAEDKADTLSLEMERRLLLEKLDGLERERQDLVVKSPIDGDVRDLDPELDTGRWLGREDEIAFVVRPGTAVVRGYLRQDGLDKIAVDADGTFYPDAFAAPSQPVTLEHVAYAAAARIDVPYLASTRGGPIATRESADHTAVPDYAVFPTRFAVARLPGQVVERGTVVVRGQRESLAYAMLRNLSRILLRESGF